MNTSQEDLSLPKIYRPPLAWKISLLILSIVFSPIIIAILVGWVLVGSRLQIASSHFFVNITTTIVCIIAVGCLIGGYVSVWNQFRLRLELLSSGILYRSLSQSFYCPWAAIKSYDLQDTDKTIILREGVIRGSVEEGLQENRAVHEVARWSRWWLGSDPARSFPIPDELWNVEGKRRVLRELSHCLLKYAPQASQI